MSYSFPLLILLSLKIINQLFRMLLAYDFHLFAMFQSISTIILCEILTAPSLVRRLFKLMPEFFFCFVLFF